VLHEDQIFEIFWADKTIDSARRSLQVVLSHARSVLDPPGAEHSMVELNDRSYRLRLRDQDVIDVDAFEFAAASAFAVSGDDRRAMLDHAASLWGGEPLPEDRDANWTYQWRERLTNRYVEVLSELVARCRAAGDHLATIPIALQIVALDQFNESAHRELMIAYARAGRRSQALRQFLACRRALIDEMGIEPSSSTARLNDRILAGEAV